MLSQAAVGAPLGDPWIWSIGATIKSQKAATKAQVNMVNLYGYCDVCLVDWMYRDWFVHSRSAIYMRSKQEAPIFESLLLNELVRATPLRVGGVDGWNGLCQINKWLKNMSYYIRVSNCWYNIVYMLSEYRLTLGLFTRVFSRVTCTSIQTYEPICYQSKLSWQ